MEKILPGCKIIITDGSTSTVYPVDSFTKNSTPTVTNTPTETETPKAGGQG